MSVAKYSFSLPRILLAAGIAVLLGGCGGGSSSVSGTTTSSTGSSTSTGGTISSIPSGTTTGSFSLSWTAPASRTDGSPLALSEIAGYRVHYGTTRGNYPNHINITNGTLQSATLTDVPVGTYYVTMSTYDASGLESSYSTPVVKQVL